MSTSFEPEPAADRAGGNRPIDLVNPAHLDLYPRRGCFVEPLVTTRSRSDAAPKTPPLFHTRSLSQQGRLKNGEGAGFPEQRTRDRRLIRISTGGPS